MRALKPSVTLLTYFATVDPDLALQAPTYLAAGVLQPGAWPEAYKCQGKPPPYIKCKKTIPDPGGGAYSAPQTL